MSSHPRVILYTRKDCHLCHDAYQILVDYGYTPQEIDIDQHPEMLEKYNTCVPVVVIDDKVRFRGRVNPILLKRLT